MKPTFLIVDDHPIVRDGLRSFLEAKFVGASITEAETLTSALDLLKTDAPPDLILCDLALPDADGFMAVAAIVSACPLATVLAMSGSSDEKIAAGALAAGAREYFSKSGTSRGLERDIRRLLAQRSVVLPKQGHAAASPPALPETDPSLGPLPPRMAQVAALCAAGHRNKAIGVLLNISENTVRAHVSTLLKHFRLRSRHELGQLAGQFSSVALAMPDREDIDARVRSREAQESTTKA